MADKYVPSEAAREMARQMRREALLLLCFDEDVDRAAALIDDHTRELVEIIESLTANPAFMGGRYVCQVNETIVDEAQARITRHTPQREESSDA